jgi:hypothetical protein
MTVPDVELRIIEPKEIFQYWDELSNSEIVKLYSIKDLAWQFGKVASSELGAVGFFSENTMKGMVIFETKQVPGNGKVELHAVTRQIYAPKNARRYLPMFLDKLKEWGYSKIGGARIGDGQAMARLFGFKVVYTYIEKEL